MYASALYGHLCACCTTVYVCSMVFVYVSGMVCVDVCPLVYFHVPDFSVSSMTGTNDLISLAHHSCMHALLYTVLICATATFSAVCAMYLAPFCPIPWEV